MLIFFQKIATQARDPMVKRDRALMNHNIKWQQGEASYVGERSQSLSLSIF